MCEQNVFTLIVDWCQLGNDDPIGQLNVHIVDHVLSHFIAVFNCVLFCVSQVGARFLLGLPSWELVRFEIVEWDRFPVLLRLVSANPVARWTATLFLGRRRRACVGWSWNRVRRHQREKTGVLTLP